MVRAALATSAERSRMRTIDGMGSVSLRFQIRRRKNSQADHDSSTLTPSPAASIDVDADRGASPETAHLAHREIVDHAAIDVDLAGIVERRHDAGQRYR